jgi:hypothetical protein
MVAHLLYRCSVIFTVTSSQSELPKKHSLNISSIISCFISMLTSLYTSITSFEIQFQILQTLVSPNLWNDDQTACAHCTAVRQSNSKLQAPIYIVTHPSEALPDRFTRWQTTSKNNTWISATYNIRGINSCSHNLHPYFIFRLYYCFLQLTVNKFT